MSELCRFFSKIIFPVETEAQAKKRIDLKGQGNSSANE